MQSKEEEETLPSSIYALLYMFSKETRLFLESVKEESLANFVQQKVFSFFKKESACIFFIDTIILYHVDGKLNDINLNHLLVVSDF